MTIEQPVRAADRLSASEVDDVLALAAAAGHADGVYPLSEDVVLRVRGDELFYAYMVDNQAIVIPETIDAIRALTGTVENASESIARTNAALGIDRSLTGAVVREPVTS